MGPGTSPWVRLQTPGKLQTAEFGRVQPSSRFLGFRLWLGSWGLPFGPLQVVFRLLEQGSEDSPVKLGVIMIRELLPQSPPQQKDQTAIGEKQKDKKSNNQGPWPTVRESEEELPVPEQSGARFFPGP